MLSGIKSAHLTGAACVLVMAGLVGVGVWVGRQTTGDLPDVVREQFSEQVKASAASVGETFGLATGSIDEETEALFLLDYLTGELSCSAISPRSGTVSAAFKTNVIADLGVEKSKKPKYLMATTGVRFVGATTGVRPANSVVWVIDENTGNFACYVLPWERAKATAGALQTGALKSIYKGKARAAILKE